MPKRRPFKQPFHLRSISSATIRHVLYFSKVSIVQRMFTVVLLVLPTRPNLVQYDEHTRWFLQQIVQ